MSEEEHFYYRQNWWISLTKSGNDTQPLRTRSDFKQALSTLKPLHQEAEGDQLEPIPYSEVQTMETSSEVFFYLVAMARILEVFLRIHRKSRRKRQAKACDRSGQPVDYRTLAKISEEWLSRIQFVTARLFSADGGPL